MENDPTVHSVPTESDIVIIGAGGSGLAAALTAAEKGISNIVVLEKRGGLGGNTARATGLFACESPVQARDRIIADKDELFKRAMQWAHWKRINPRIFRAFLNKSGDTIRWLTEMGLEFNVIAFFPNQNPRVEHVAKGKGAQLTQVLAAKCQDAGVKIFLHCSATKLLYNDHKDTISGVAAARGDEKFEIKTRCVIIATGGFGGNKALLTQLCPHYSQDMPLRGVPLMGDGIQMAREVGVAIDNAVPLLEEGPRIEANAWPLGGCEREPVAVWVNKLGNRFADEALGNHPFESVHPIHCQPDRVCYSLIDSSIKQLLMEKLPSLEKSLISEASSGKVKVSESWNEIALWIGADPVVLQTTVNEYNYCCEHGYDSLFAKEQRYLKPLLVPPFYAIRGYPYILDTLGGIIINEKMETLNNQNEIVRGIYAAGVTTSGWESDSYCSDLSGSAFGYAINSGRIAGENAAKFVKNGKL